MDPGERPPKAGEKRVSFKDRLRNRFLGRKSLTGALVEVALLEERHEEEEPRTSTFDDVLEFGKQSGLENKKVARYWRRLIDDSSHIFEVASRDRQKESNEQKIRDIRTQGVDVYELPAVNGVWLGRFHGSQDGDLCIAYYYEHKGKYLQLFGRTPEGPAMTSHIGDQLYGTDPADRAKEQRSYILHDDNLARVMAHRGTLQIFTSSGTAAFFESYLASRQTETPPPDINYLAP